MKNNVVIIKERNIVKLLLFGIGILLIFWVFGLLIVFIFKDIIWIIGVRMIDNKNVLINIKIYLIVKGIILFYFNYL